MKTKRIFWAIGLSLGICLLSLTGCYTQIGATRDSDREEAEGENVYATQQDLDTSIVENNYEGATENYYGDEWSPRARVGFSYYYPSYYWPSYAFSVAYADPWFYDSYWAYDPWWCGTPYNRYPMNGYGYGYGYGYYPPYSSYPSAYYPYHYGGGVVPRATRDFGNTRGGGGRGTTTTSGYQPSGGEVRSGLDLPTGAGYEQTPASVRNRTGSATVKTPQRSAGTQRGFAPRSGDNRSVGSGNRGTRGSGVRSGSSRGTNNRNMQVPAYTPPKNRGTVPTVNPPARRSSESPAPTGDRQTGSSRGGNAPSYSPPPPRTPSPPPPPSTSSAPANSGTRGSGNRGGRP